jgi:DNA repair protein RadC
MAQELMGKDTNLAMLASKSLSDLTKFQGIGRDKAVTLLAAFELSRRIQSQSKWLAENKIATPKNIADMFIPLLRDELKEKFILVCLNSANKIIRHETISIGSLNSGVIHPREIFKVAIENSSASVVLIHNHPSGNPEPSSVDLLTTKKLVEAGKILDIPVSDHIIVAGNLYTSFFERGLL